MNTRTHRDDFRVREPLIMLYIGDSTGAVGNDLSRIYPAYVAAAAHGHWRIYQPETGPWEYNLVLARNTEQVLGAFRPKAWHRAYDARMYFYGEMAELQAQLDYVGKRVPDRFRGHSVRYLDPAENHAQASLLS